jgi:tRNA pseudouridine55 synthase
VGRIAQVPPRHAALKFEGRAYYDYARSGVDIPRPAREIEIAAIELVDWSAPDAIVRVDCGKGTYVRVLAEDVAAALGTVAHLAALRRTAVGSFRVERACTLEQLEALDAAARDARLLSADASLADMPRLDVEPDVARALREGRMPRVRARAAGRFRAYADDAFVGVVESDAVALRAVRLARVDE